MGTKYTGNPESSLTTYMKRPLTELTSVKMPIGASLEHVGPNPDVAGEEIFEMKVPPLNFPGVFEIQPIASCIVRSTPKAIQIEGRTVRVTGAGEDVMKDTQFSMLVEFTWADTPSKQEVIFTGSIKFGMPPIPADKGTIAKEAFETVGSGAMDLSMNILASGLAQSLAEDYDRWASEQSR